ncbi:hypothetical protein [Qipengyuania gaetbuli]|uniref:hypothetical protein n=1 Tax=Qipengyuania gaetbuli TaxID=266952 RepID=UPI001CFCF246|nr:hypothetical protein [Qipengyuania gaetbuli]
MANSIINRTVGGATTEHFPELDFVIAVLLAKAEELVKAPTHGHALPLAQDVADWLAEFGYDVSPRLILDEARGVGRLA